MTTLETMLAPLLAVASATAAFTAPAPVRALALDTPLLAYATGRAGGDCDRVRIRNLTTRRTVRLGRPTSCEQTSTGTGIAALSIAGNRVLWLHFTGGNIREWSLFTATTTAPRPRRLRFVARDVDAAAPIVLGEGDTSRFGNLLPYAVGREVVVLRPNGSRAFAWTAPARVTAVGANAGGLAVALEDGRIVVFEDGSLLDEIRLPSAASAVFVTGSGIAAQLSRQLYFLAGSPIDRWPLPARAQLRDADGLRGVYLTQDRARLVGLLNGRTRDLGPATDVQLEHATVAVALGRRIRVFRI